MLSEDDEVLEPTATLLKTGAERSEDVVGVPVFSRHDEHGKYRERCHLARRHVFVPSCQFVPVVVVGAAIRVVVAHIRRALDPSSIVELEQDAVGVVDKDRVYIPLSVGERVHGTGQLGALRLQFGRQSFDVSHGERKMANTYLI